MKKLPRPQDREALLTERRNVKMASSAHAYTRGSTGKFYEWLDTVQPGALPHGTSIWICGDCHSSNLGPIADAEGEVHILVRDLDQTVIGNPAHDLIRLGLSLATAVRDSDLPGGTTVTMLEHMVAAYQASFSNADDVCKMPKVVRSSMRQASGRTWKQLAEERIEDTSPTIPLGKRFWPLSHKERSALKELVHTEEVRTLVTMLRGRDDDAHVHMRDAAYWVKGCSSLGRARMAVIVGAGEPPYKEEALCLLDIKEAVTAAAPRDAHAQMPKSNGQRVVTGARHVSPPFGERMRAADLLGKSVFIRELMPQDLKLEIDRLTSGEAIKVARFLSEVVGKAHARQMTPNSRRRWRSELTRNQPKSFAAPSWFWRSVVDLVGIHETAYLDHCRAFERQRAR